ncbi:DnaJ domain-containing protein [Psittacicella hinzii]|uniref:J domain-containing protein n=1 Tax=Psittacicella hinzii TaxID=2028575 RepID=A0A3A1YRI3_9GAMM|nr:DnaJ domain-containing protein [Psittacicella hinzii]RIY40802.1 hypothetical protein CKF58_00140 [Psittacicella hinzii]
MRRRFPYTALVFALIGGLITNSIFGAIIGFVIGLYFDNRGIGSAGGNPETEARQYTYIAQIIGKILQITGKNSPRHIANAQRLFIQEISAGATGKVDVHAISEQISIVANDPSFQESLAINGLRNTLVNSYSRSPATVLAQIIHICYSASEGQVDNNFYQAIFTIAGAIGLPQQIAIVLLMRFANYGQEAWGDGNPFGSYSHGYGNGGSSYNQGGYGGGSGGGYGGYNSRAAEAQKALEQAYSLLGVDRNVSKQELNRAKKRLLAKWHPDKAPDDSKRAEYTEMSQKINNAADLIAADRGF